jgi:seryl-tRNA(Sec) selenium transferase
VANASQGSAKVVHVVANVSEGSAKVVHVVASAGEGSAKVVHVVANAGEGSKVVYVVAKRQNRKTVRQTIVCRSKNILYIVHFTHIIIELELLSFYKYKRKYIHNF